MNMSTNRSGNTPRLLDLFAGCGGMSLGFQRAGFEVAAAYDAWPAAVRCYAQNFNHPVYQRDLSDAAEVIGEVRELKPDVVIGGPPCQDFSQAGKRREGARADLTRAYAEIVRALAPLWFVMENVDRAAKSRSYADARALLKAAGYGLTETVLDASRCGAPQKRKRFFAVGRLGAPDGFLTPFILENLAKNPLTVRQYMGGELEIDYYYRHPRNYSRRGVFSVDEPSPTVRGVNRPLPAGYPGHPGDPVEVFEGLRPLTTLERARIQTFPVGFVFPGGKTETEQLIGNAVPVELAAFVGKAIAVYEAQGAGQPRRAAQTVGAVPA